MRRSILFTIRVNRAERKMISQLAQKLQRSQADAVRFLILQFNGSDRTILPEIPNQDTNSTTNQFPNLED